MFIIIYRGNGQRIIAFALIGAVLGALLFFLLKSWMPEAWRPGLLIGSVSWGAVVGLWYAVRHLRPGEAKTLVDEKTGQVTRVTETHDLFFMPPIVWAVLGTIAAVLVSAFGVAMSMYETARRSDPGTGYSAYKAADEKIMASSGLPIARERTRSYCQLSEQACTLLLHVPDLAKVPKESRWSVAWDLWTLGAQLAHFLEPQPDRVVLGVRGAEGYEFAIVGRVVEKLEDAGDALIDRTAGIRSERRLQEYFSQPNPGPCCPGCRGR